MIAFRIAGGISASDTSWRFSSKNTASGVWPSAANTRLACGAWVTRSSTGSRSNASAPALVASPMNANPGNANVATSTPAARPATIIVATLVTRTQVA